MSFRIPKIRNTNSQQQQQQNFGSPNNNKGIVWSCLLRNETILAEAGEDEWSQDESFIKIAQELIHKKPTPGFEYARNRRSKLRGIKFHVYENQENNMQQLQSQQRPLIWTFACVYNPTTGISLEQVKSFLEKLVYITDLYRAEDQMWRKGDMLCVQETFAPILYQRMSEVSYMGKVAMVNNEVSDLKNVMSNNIDLILERDEHLHDLNDRSDKMLELSKVFKKQTNKIKRFKQWQNAKHGVVIGTAVTAGVAVVTIPPIIALL